MSPVLITPEWVHALLHGYLHPLLPDFIWLYSPKNTHTYIFMHFSVTLVCMDHVTWSLIKKNKPCNNVLNEFSLMSAGSPIWPRFTVTPPNRSTFPARVLLPSTLWSWEQVTPQENPRAAAARAGHTSKQNLTNGDNLDVNARAAMLQRNYEQPLKKKQNMLRFYRHGYQRPQYSYVKVHWKLHKYRKDPLKSSRRNQPQN